MCVRILGPKYMTSGVTIKSDQKQKLKSSNNKTINQGQAQDQHKRF